MDKRDLFETSIGAQLRQAEAPVPAGMWDRIRNDIAETSAGTGVSKGAWYLGGIAAALMLGSLSWLSESTPEIPQTSQVQHVVITRAMDETPRENTAPILHGETDQAAEESGDQPTESIQTAVLPTTEPGEESPETAPTPASEIAGEAIENEPETEDAPLSAQADEDKKLPVRVSRPTVLSDTDVPGGDGADARADRLDNEPVPTEEIGRLEVRIQADHTEGHAPFTSNLSAKGNADSYHWDLGAAGIVEGQNAKVTFEDPGTYTVYLVGSNRNGEMRSKPITITVKEGSNLVVPDSFSPNGDGINDTYSVSGVGIQSFRLTIIDSKGRVVFETHNMDMAWDAQADNHPVIGEYYRVNVQAVGVDGKSYNLSKSLRIIL